MHRLGTNWMPPAGGSYSAQNFAQLVTDLLNQQSEVQQYAPSLSSQWGFLAKQGQLLRAGQLASISQAQWVAQYRAYWAALQGQLPSQDQMVAQRYVTDLETDAGAGFPQGVQADVTTYGDAAGQAGAAIGGALGVLTQYIPLIVGAIVIALVVPPLIRALDD